MKNTKFSRKILSIFIALILVVSFFNINITNVNANANENSRIVIKNYNDGYYYSHHVTTDFGNKNRNWMMFLDDNKRISELSIPGTHDTMANYELTHIIRTQALSLNAQLNAGVRFLDIRCRYDGNNFYINHGGIALKYSFRDVLNTVRDFLKQNPSETVLMRIKQEGSEYSDSQFEKRLLQYVEEYKNLFWENRPFTTSNPTLGEVRGKIVAYNDVYGINMGIDYRTLNKQDNYNLGTNWDLYRKWTDVKTHLENARKGSKDTTYINYLSGSGGSFPYFVASGQSSPEMSAPRLATGLAGPAFQGWYPDFPRGALNDILFEGVNILATENIQSNSGRVGIIMADFVGRGLINAVISKNDFGTNNYIKVNGVNNSGKNQEESVRINFDFNLKNIYLVNKKNSPIHSGFGDTKYFSFKVLDGNKNEKFSIKLNGNENAQNYNLSNISFNIGDYIEIYHEEPFRLEYKNLEVNKQSSKLQLYKIEDGYLRPIQTNNYIKVNGVDDSGTKKIESFKINFDFDKRQINFISKNKAAIHSGFGNTKYFSFAVLNGDKYPKYSFKLNGNESPQKYNLSDVSFNIGDYIEIYHEEPFRLEYENLGVNKQSEVLQLYKIENGYLTPIQISNYIKISGVDSSGTKKVESFRINFDFNARQINFINRNKDAINSNFGNNKYFSFAVLNGDKSPKYRFKLNGKESPQNYNLLDANFNIGDYIEIYHEDPSKIEYKNLGVNGQSEILKLYKIEDGYLRPIETASYIKVSGVNDSGTSQVEKFRINFDFNSNKISFTNKKFEAIHSGFGNTKYFSFRILDKNKKEKLNIRLNGNNSILIYTPNMSFNIGDYIEVYHEEPFRLEYENLGIDKQNKVSQLYRIENGYLTKM